jgi:hypothetical protein
VGVICGLHRLGLVLALVIMPAPASALITMSFESVPGAVSLTGSGTSIAALDFGTVSAFDTVNAGVTRSVGGASYSVATNFGVRVTRVVSVSANYTLRANLASVHALTWRVNGVTMTTTAATVAATQPFGSTVPHTLELEVPFTHPSGLVTTVLEVIAIAN